MPATFFLKFLGTLVLTAWRDFFLLPIYARRLDSPTLFLYS